MNLLQETIETIKESGHEISDIIFIGSENSVYQCTWNEYVKLADREYDHKNWNICGARGVAYDLIIVFSDGGRMIRIGDDDGERWRYYMPYLGQVNKKEITNLFVQNENSDWFTLEEINDNLFCVPYHT
jgi:hypothetical protein